jgi:pyruvate-formate lyase-activating enzyme
MAERFVPVHEDPRVHAFMAADAPAQVEILTAWGLRPAVALVLLNACENQCFFCANAGTTAVPPERNTPWEHIERHLRGKPPGIDRLLVGGNEPTLHPHFDRMMALAHELGFREVELMTSGLQLAVPGRLAAWVAHGLREVAIPIYSADAALHDAVCGTPCWDRLVAGLDAARAAGVRVWLHTLALRRTVDGLPALAALARERWDAELAVAPLREKQGLFRWDAETVTLDVLARALDGLPEHVALVGMPDCLDRGRARGSAQVIEMYFRTQLRAFDPVCSACLDQPSCPGVVAAQLQRHGASGLSPRLGA